VRKIKLALVTRLLVNHQTRSRVSGASTYKLHTSLIDHVNMPFIRVSLSDRVVMSARNWSEGMANFSRRITEELIIDRFFHCKWPTLSTEDIYLH